MNDHRIGGVEGFRGGPELSEDALAALLEREGGLQVHQFVGVLLVLVVDEEDALLSTTTTEPVDIS